MKHDSLGDRMKTYEAVPKLHLCRRVPVIIRIDGKAFHTFTRGFEKPFDDAIEYAMKDTMVKLCKNIQGCVLGYTQSDEISLVLCDYQKIDTAAWFDYNVEKVCSIASSMATLYFFRALCEYKYNLWLSNDMGFEEKIKFIDKKLSTDIFFDARCSNLPKEEVINYMIWRQQDATRNSIQALAQSRFSHKELQGLKCGQLQDKIFTEANINWNGLSVYQKRGVCAVKQMVEMPNIKLLNKAADPVYDVESKVWRSKWIIDNDTPIFTQDREYITSRIEFS